MKQVKQLVFAGLTLAVSLLGMLSLGFRILPPFFVLIAFVLAIPALVVDINILIERYSGDPPAEPERERMKQRQKYRL